MGANRDEKILRGVEGELITKGADKMASSMCCYLLLDSWNVTFHTDSEGRAIFLVNPHVRTEYDDR